MDTRTPRSPSSDFVDRGLRATSGMETRSRLVLGIGAALLVVAALYIWHLLAGAGEHKGPPAAPVHVAPAQLGDTSVVEKTIGTVIAESTVNVTAQVSGQLIAADFREGQLVHKNDLLFQIDPKPFQAILDQQLANLARDRANLVSAQNDARRYVALFAQNAASQSQRDQAVATAKADAAIVRADSATVETARLNLSYTQIRSPIDGKTGPILIQPGNLITAGGSSPLVSIAQVQPIKVSLNLPQNDLSQIQAQMTAGALIVDIPMDGGHETARADFVGNAVSDQTGTIELRATFPNADLRLVPGQMVGVGVAIRNLRHVLIVPRNAVNAGPQGPFVYVVDPHQHAAVVPVTVLNDDGTDDAIAGDLHPHQLVITEGQLRVVPGIAVRIVKGGMLASPSQAAPGAQ
ncbi:MAG: efflux RND transporter periplasmic adaptor subunit [Alphaproteobacteria bacterium]|nr:efflux RND transporter periplasmic adaptor subunit [Alphaproteobacteria bacterium]